MFSAASGDSGPQESWTGPVRRGRRKGSTAQQQNSTCLNQGKTRVLRGQRVGALDNGESSPAESESSDQGETIDLLEQVQSSQLCRSEFLKKGGIQLGHCFPVLKLAAEHWQS